MSDLDELANAARPQHVTTRRPPQQPAVYITPPGPPKSAFSSGFYGTFGVIAALVVVCLGWFLIRMINEGIAEQRLQNQRDALAREKQSIVNAEMRRDAEYGRQLALENERQQKVMDEFERLRPQREAKIKADFERIRVTAAKQQAEATTRRAEIERRNDTAKKHVLADGSVLGREITFTARNNSERAIMNATIAVFAEDGTLPLQTVEIPALAPHEQWSKAVQMEQGFNYNRRFKFETLDAYYAAEAATRPAIK